jgi:hypothetical protein
MNKFNQIKRHCQIRASQRLNFNFTKKDHDNIVRLIQKGQADFVRRQSKRVTIWAVDYNCEIFKVVYDKNRKLIVTILNESVWTTLEREDEQKRKKISYQKQAQSS